MRPPRLLVGPLVPFALALVGVIALPLVGYGLMRPQEAGDFASGLSAHVAWARLIALALVIVGSVQLARAARRTPGRAFASAVVAMVACTAVAGAAALPVLDERVMSGVTERYVTDAPASELEWRAEDAGPRHRGEWFRAIGHAHLENHTGLVEIPLPDLAKGDSYRVMVAYRTGGNESQAYFASGFQGWTPMHQCRGWEGQHPHPRGPDAEGGRVTSAFTRECSAMRGGPVTLSAAWTGYTPSDTHVSVMVQPTFAKHVLARLDASLVLVGVVGALSAFTAVAHAVTLKGVDPAARRDATRVVLGGVTLVTAGWAIATALTLVGGGDAWWLNDSTRARLGSFLVISALATAGNVAFIALLSPTRDVVPAADALKWSALTTTAVVIVAPAAAANAWLREGPTALAGVAVSVLVLALTAAAAWGAREGGAGVAGSRSEATGGAP